MSSDSCSLRLLSPSGRECKVGELVLRQSQYFSKALIHIYATWSLSHAAKAKHAYTNDHRGWFYHTCYLLMKRNGMRKKSILVCIFKGRWELRFSAAVWGIWRIYLMHLSVFSYKFVTKYFYHALLSKITLDLSICMQLQFLDKRLTFRQTPQ